MHYIIFYVHSTVSLFLVSICAMSYAIHYIIYALYKSVLESHCQLISREYMHYVIRTTIYMHSMSQFWRVIVSLFLVITCAMSYIYYIKY